MGHASRLTQVLTVDLAPSASIELAHNLHVNNYPVAPNIVFPNRGTHIRVVAVTATSVSFENPTSESLSAEFFLERQHSIQLGNEDTSYWQGMDGSASEGTLQDAYDAGPPVDIALSDALGGITIKDSPAGVAGPVLAITDNTEASAFLEVSPDGIATDFAVEMRDSDAPVAPANAVRLRSHDGVLELSESTGAYAQLASIASAFTAAVIGMYGSIFSDGVDGDADLDGTNTVSWATKSGNTYTVTRVAFLNNLLVRSGVTLFTANFHGPYGKGKCTVESGGRIHNNGNNASGATGGAATAAGTLKANVAGVNGGLGVGANGNLSSGVWLPMPNNRYTGGPGGASGATAGGAAGTVSAQGATRGSPHGAGPGMAFANISQVGVDTPTFGSSGGAGAGDGANNGGGSGAAGGGMHLGFGEVQNDGDITANGGNGGNGVAGNAAGGGGGGGGGIRVDTGLFSGSQPVAQAGAGGAGSGTGGVGNTGIEGQVIVNMPMAA